MNSINISAELSNREWIIKGRCREAFMSWISMNYAEDQQEDQPNYENLILAETLSARTDRDRGRKK